MKGKWGLKIFVALGFFCLGGMVFLSSSPESQREPAAVPGNAGVSFPVTLVCSGLATSEGVFQFSAEPGELVVNFDPEGNARVTGVAHVVLRSLGDDSVFEGPLRLQGSRSKDGLHFNLEGSKQGQQFLFELTKTGESQATRIVTGPSGGKEKSYFSSRCVEMN